MGDLGDRGRKARGEGGGLLRKIGTAHRLPDPVKCLLISGITLPFLLGWVARFHSISADPTVSSYVSRDFLPIMLTFQWVQSLGHIAIILASLTLIRMGRERALWLVHAEIQWWFGCFAFSLYALGPFTSPFAMLVLILPIAGLLFLPPRAMVYGLVMLGLYSITMIGLERLELIPYAPFLEHPPLEGGRPVTAWVVSVGAPAFFAAILVLFLYAWVVIQWRRREAELEELIGTDPLTGIANRRVFFARLAEELARADRHARSLTLLMVDIDHFKDVNDTHGHPVGDAILRGVAETLEGTLRTADLVSRYGGEEFALILPETSSDEAGVAAERIQDAVRAYVFEGGAEPIGVTTSLGVATRKPTESLHQLVSRADQALYVAKNGGRNRVEFSA